MHLIRLIPWHVLYWFHGDMGKQVIALRALQTTFNPPDWGAVPYSLTGLPMLGHADPVEFMSYHSVPATTSVENFASNWQEQPSRILGRVGPPGDESLDFGAYQKSRNEARRGVLIGPFRSL